MNKHFRSILLGAALLAGAPAILTAADVGLLSWDIGGGFAGVADSKFRQRSNEGNLSSTETEFHAIGSLQAKPGFLIRFGFELQRFDLGVPERITLPSNLESMNLVVVADLQLGDAWLFRIDAHPGFYTASDDYSADTFNVPITLGGSYFVSGDLQIVMGVSIDVNRKYPVLPAAGVRWRLGKDWVLNGILPAPRLEYTMNEKLMLYVGGDFNGSTYRVGSSFGDLNGRPELNRAYVDFLQIRVGGGASWKVDPHTTFEIEAGCATMQDYDFHRAEVGVRDRGTPPYARIGFQTSF